MEGMSSILRDHIILIIFQSWILEPHWSAIRGPSWVALSYVNRPDPPRQNGPIYIQNDYSVSENQYSWTKVADYVWIDQPVYVHHLVI